MSRARSKAFSIEFFADIKANENHLQLCGWLSIHCPDAIIENDNHSRFDFVATSRFTWQSATARALMGVFGGFVLALCFMVGTAAALTAAGWMPRADASIAAGMLAFLVWVAAVIGAFAAHSVRFAATWGCSGAAGFALLGWVCLHG